jgi:hypothetical protein
MEQAAHPPHRWLLRSLIGIATVIGIFAIFAVWANRQLLNTGGWTSTSTKLIESPPIREAVSGYLTEEIYDNVNVTGELRSIFPSQLKPLAGPAAGALRSVVQKGVNLALERPEVQQLWRSANEVAHAQFVKLIENKGSVVKTPGHGRVVLDLRPLVTQAAQRVGVPASTVERIPPKVAEIQVVKSKSLQTLQTAVNVLRSLALALPLLALLLYGLTIYIARGRRARTLIAVGTALIFAGVIVLIARSLIGKVVVESLASTAAVQPAAAAAWSIGTGILVSVAGAVIFIGVPVILAGILGGPTRPARDLRHSMAPYLRDRPGIAFGAMGLLLVILFAWGPIPATRSWLGVLLIIVLAMFAVEMLRRQTAVEFPDAQVAPLELRHRMESIRHRFSGAQSSLWAEAHATRQRWRPNGPPPQATAPSESGVDMAGRPPSDAAITTPLPPHPAQTGAAVATRDLAGQLQRLAALHTAGALTDEEYTAAKQRLISGAA